MKKSGKICQSLLFLIIIFLPSHCFSAVQAKHADAVSKTSVLESYGRLPLAFIANKGQIDPSVSFYLRCSQGSIFFTDDKIVYSIFSKRVSGTDKNDNLELKRLSFSLTPVGANKAVKPIARKKLTGKVNYLTGGDPKTWRKDVPIFKEIIYQGIYNGIDLKIYGTNSQMEYDFVVTPGARPDDIRMSFEGVEALFVDKMGNLVIKTAISEIKHLKPVIYQEIDGKRHSVKGSFRVVKNCVSFDIKKYDKNHTLVIDPLTLSYSTYLGGSGDDSVMPMAPVPVFAPHKTSVFVDAWGNAYITGDTTSSDFPTQNPYQGTFTGGMYDAFITKLSSDGNSLVYSTYLGGSMDDWTSGIAVDASGNAYITGSTGSTDFPTQNPYQGTFSGMMFDAFITKLSPAGNNLIYSTYLGGSMDDWTSGIAVDASGNAYVTGSTASTDFPTQNPYQGTFAGGAMFDAFVTKLSPEGNSLVYSTFLGGSMDDWTTDIAVDPSGNAYITGGTGSTDFPTQNAYQIILNGMMLDAFLTKLSPSGSSLIYSTYLGGSQGDWASGISIDEQGSVYITGITMSTDFPTGNAYQLSINGMQDAFVTKLSPAGNILIYSTYLGGSGDDWTSDIAVDTLGNAYITGGTSSDDFPTRNAYQWSNAGMTDAFVTKLMISATISGTVYDSYGNPISGHMVHAWTGKPGQVTGFTSTANTDVDGNYQISNLPPGTYYLQAMKWMGQTSFINEWWADPESTIDATEAQGVTVALGEEVAGKDFQLDSGAATITGTVMDSEGNEIWLMIINALINNPCGPVQYVGYGISGFEGGPHPGNGDYAISGLPPGEYYLNITDTGALDERNYVHKWWADGDGVTCCTDAQHVSLDAGETVSGKDFCLETGAGRISGRIMDDADMPIRDTDILLLAYNGHPCGGINRIGSTWMDRSNGSYSLEGLPPGPYYLHALNFDFPYTNEWWADFQSVIDCNDAQQITLANQEHITEIDFQLDDGAVTVSGTVRDDENNPITGSEMVVVAYEGTPCGSTRNAGGIWVNQSDGTYSIYGLSPGTYYLHAVNMGGNPYLNEWWGSSRSITSCSGANSITLSSGGSATGRDFQLDTGAVTISGTVVTDSTYDPITSGNIMVVAYSGTSCDSLQGVGGAWTKPCNGIYKISGLPAGSYYLQAVNLLGGPFINEWWSVTGSVLDCVDAHAIAIASGGTSINNDFQLDTGGASILGTVLDSGDNPITSGQIMVFAHTGEPCDENRPVGFSFTDLVDGTYQVYGLPADLYSLYAVDVAGSDYQNEWWSITGSVADCNEAQFIALGSGGSSSGNNFQLDIGVSQSIVTGLGSYPTQGGWIETFHSDYSPEDWLRIRWSGYNAANGETRIATGDIDGDGKDEIVVGLGPVSGDSTIPGGWFEIFDDDYTHLAWGRVSWPVYNTANGETWPACGDLDGDGTDEIIVGLGTYPANGGWFEVFDYDSGSVTHQAWQRVRWINYEYNSANGEVRPACGDIDDDSRDEIVVGLGPVPGNPSLPGGWFEIFDDDLSHLDWGLVEFTGYNSTNGETWPACGDVDGDGIDEIIIGLGTYTTNGGWFEVFDYAAGSVTHKAWDNIDWRAYSIINGETRPACGDIDGDGRDEIIISLGSGGHGYMKVLDDDSAGYTHMAWPHISWPDYCSANGGTWPAIKVK